MLDLNIFLSTRSFSLWSRLLSFVALTNVVFYGHLLAEVASSLGVRSSVCFAFGQINWLIDWLTHRLHWFHWSEQRRSHSSAGMSKHRLKRTITPTISNNTQLISSSSFRFQFNWKARLQWTSRYGNMNIVFNGNVPISTVNLLIIAKAV